MGKVCRRSGDCKGAQRPLPLGERRTFDSDWSLRKSLSKVLWCYFWNKSKNSTAKGADDSDRKTHIALSRQGQPYTQQPQIQRKERGRGSDERQCCFFVEQGIKEAYEQLFGAAVERYNAKQKRADRKIKTSYYEHLFKRSLAPSVVTSADKRKSFYEDVVQIGTMQDTGVGTPDAEIAATCLTEYMQGFQQRNPNFYVFNAVLHLDEATPHLHIDYIPVGHYKQGVDTQNGIAQALKEMGYGTGKEAIARWREAECKVLTEICNRHDIQIAAPEKTRGSLTVEQYREYAKVKEQVDEKKEEAARLDKQCQEKTTALNETTASLESNQSLLETSAQKVSQIKSINEIETGKTFLGGKVTLSKEDFGTLSDLAKKQIAAENKENSLKARITTLETQNQSITTEKKRLEEQNAELRKENGELQSVYGRIAIAKIRSERDNLQRQLDRVMEFIKSLGLAERLQAFLHQKGRGVRK